MLSGPHGRKQRGGGRTGPRGLALPEDKGLSLSALGQDSEWSHGSEAESMGWVRSWRYLHCWHLGGGRGRGGSRGQGWECALLETMK